MIRLYCMPYSYCFDTVVERVSKVLTSIGIENTIEKKLINNDDLWIVWWPEIPFLPKNTIIYNMDPLVPHMEKQLLKIINNNKKSNIKFLEYSYSPENYKFYKKYNYDFKILPYGIFENTDFGEKIEKYDILFYGGYNYRRDEILDGLKRRYNCCILYNVIFTDEEKREFINKSKIVLSLCSDDAKKHNTNDLARLNVVIENKGFILAESIGDKMFEGISGINFFDISNLYSTIDYYLDKPKLRENISNNVYNNCKTFYNLEKDLLKLKYYFNKKNN